IATLDVAGLESGLEPARTLRRGAVRERIGHGVAARLLLQRVVANLRGGIERGFDVAFLQPMKLRLRAVAPDAGETVGLEFDAHRQTARPLHALAATFEILFLAHDADQVLHVMADFVRDHVRTCEVAAGMKARVHLVEEIEIEIDAMIGGTVERAHGFRGGAAARARLAMEQQELRLFVLLTLGLEVGAPDVFGAAEDRTHETHLRIVGVERRVRPRRCDLLARVGAEEQAEQQRAQLREHEAEHDDDQDAAEPQMESAEPEAAASVAAAAAVVLDDVVALSTLLPIHTADLARREHQHYPPREVLASRSRVAIAISSRITAERAAAHGLTAVAARIR